VGWGFNWPVTKYLVSELPVLTMRGITGIVGAALAGCHRAWRWGQSLRVERKLWPRLMLAALLNVTGWMVLMGWRCSGAGQRSRPDCLHHAGLGLALGLAGARRAADRAAQLCAGNGVPRLAVIMGGNGFSASAAKLPGILMR